MKVILADNSGFCFGVERAINETLKVIENKDKVYSLGPLIHNNQVITKLNKKGLVTIDDVTEANGGSVIIRSHGVPLNTYKEIESRDMEYIELTCPFVRKIQKKAKEYYDKGYQIIIIGNPEHPEVMGINGWCENSAIIINSKQDIEDMKKYDKICIVTQTTMEQKKFFSLKKLLMSKGNEVKVFNTICNATKLRQDSCKEVAERVDAMIVIGGYHSSNTQKLVSISKEKCKNTYHIETINDLDLNDFKKYNIIGITAGASTPDWIIKEVVKKVNNADNNEMNKMMEEIEKTLVDYKRGDIVKGTVISVNKDEVMVNIGHKADGIITKNELSNDPYIDPENMVKSGQEIEVYIKSLDDGEGNIVLSKKRVDNIKGWEELEEAYNNNELLEAKVVEVVKGGTIALVNNLRGFIPASHMSINYVDDLNKFLGETFNVKIIEFDKEKRRLVLSRKEIEMEELEKKKEKLWNSLENGMEIEGEVKRLTNFGAFVDIGGVDGLVHISELSWGRVGHPSEIVKVGDEVEVIVLDFDKSKERISLGYKQTKPHPWENIDEKYAVGDIVEGKVVRLVDFGVFVELEPGLDGLVHISEISHSHIAKPSEVVEKGEDVKVKILNIDKENHRLSLSMKEAIENEDLNYKGEEDSDLTVGDVVKKDKE